MFFLVDAFTDKPFLGNPAGVCVLDDISDTYKMQKVAEYFKWSEISYISKLSSNKYQIRWFSPLDEAPLCGHATLAASHILFSERIFSGNKIEFVYNDGVLYIEHCDNYLTMSFPIKSVHKCDTIPFDVNELIGITDYNCVLKDDLAYMIVLNDYHLVQNLVPNIEVIKKVNARAIIVTATGPHGFDFCSRYFAPRVGLYEDPVCGSAHCRLSYYWGNILGKKNMKAFQASKRTGVLHLELDNNRVKISGQAVTIANLCHFFNHLFP